MMNKDAIQYLQETGIKPAARILEKKDRLFSIDHEGKATELFKPADRILALHGRLFEVNNENNLIELPDREQKIAKQQLRLHTLTGLVNYIQSNLDRTDESLYLHVLNEREVELKGKLNVDGNREELAAVEAIVPKFHFDYFYDSEALNIALQAVFVQNEDRENLLQIVGNMVEENIQSIGDDGVSQSVVIKNGITSKSAAKVPNPVLLAPYRTFIEVKQPVSRYVFRMREGGQGALFEADGGAWRNQAIANIKDYLTAQLTTEIESGRMTILA